MVLSKLIKKAYKMTTKTYDNQSALEYLQTIPSQLLSQIIKGEIDLNALAKVELSYRGQDENGKWVGFKEAAKIHKIQ